MASALFAGLTVLLNQIQRRQAEGTARDAGNVRAALLTLEEYLAGWAEQAGATNTIARHWAEGLPETAGQAMDSLLDSMAGQSMWSASVDSALGRELPDLIPPSFAVDRNSQVTVERVLRVYAPEFYDFLVAFSRRREQLDAMAAELERRHATDGPEAVEAYLSELEAGARGLEEAHRRLAEFIAGNFPIRDS